VRFYLDIESGFAMFSGKGSILSGRIKKRNLTRTEKAKTEKQKKINGGAGLYA
jgi:hypothetical protein